MSIVIFSDIRVAEELLVSALEKYFDDLDWKGAYKNFPKVRINNEFPWVPYMRNPSAWSGGQLDLGKVIDNQTALFPSLTVVNDSDAKATTQFIRKDSTSLVTEDLVEFKELASKDSQFISPEGLQAIEDAITANGVVYGSRIMYKKTEVMKIDVTVDDESDIKNRIFDLVMQFLVGQGQIDLNNDEKIEIKTETIHGNRSGVYNIQFGRVLKGSTIQFDVNYDIVQVYYNTDAGVINSVDITHHVEVPK